MAVTAREILLVFRGQNYLSNQIRKVGSDVGALSRGNQLAHQRAQLMINQRRLQTTKSIAANEFASLATGTRQINLQKAKLALSDKEFANVKAMRTNYERQLLNVRQISQVERSIQTISSKGGRGLGGMNLKELQVEHTRLLSQMETLKLNEAQLNEVASRGSLEHKRYAAAVTEAAQREAVLVQRINATSEALDLNTAKLRQNKLATDMLPTQNFADTAAKVEHAGRLVQMFGLITGAVMGYAADKAAQFNTQITIAASKVKQPGMSVAQIGQNANLIQQRLLDQLASGTSVASPTDLTQATYRTLSGLQLPGNFKSQIKEATDLVKQFGNVVKANFGMTDITQVTNGAILAMRDFQIPLKQVPKLLNTMQAAEKYGRMTMGEFIATFNQAAPAARAANYSFTQMASTIAFLSTKMTTAPAATGYARLLQTLAQNADKFNKAGYQVTDKSGKNLLPIEQIIKNITDKNPELAKGGVALQNFFKDVTGQTGYLQARKVFVFLSQDLAGLDKVTKQVTGDQKVLSTTIKGAGKSPGVQWAEFKNQLQGILLILGAGAIPAFKSFAAPLISAVKWFDKLSPSTQRFIGYALALTGILALLGGTLVAVGAGLARIGAGIKLLLMTRTATAALSAEAGLVQIRFALMLGTVGLLILAFTQFHSQTMAVVNALGGVGGVMSLAFGAAAGIAVLRLVGYVSQLTKATYAFRDAEVAADAVNPFLLMAAALGILVVAYATHTEQIKRGYERMLNDIYSFFIDHFVNPQIRALDVLINAYNKYFGWLTGNIGRVNEISNKAIFDVGGYKKMLAERQKDPRFADRWNDALASAINPLTLFNKQMKLGITPTFGTFWLSHIQYTFKEAQKAYDKLKKHILDDSIKNSIKDLPKPLVPPVGSSAAVMAHYKEQLALYNKLKRAASDYNKVAVNDKVTKAAEKYGTTVTKSFTQAYNAYVKLLRIAKADPTNLQKEIAAQNALMALQAVATKQQLAAAEKTANAMTSSATTAKTTFKDILSSVQGMYNNFLQQEQSAFGTLFQGPFMQSPMMQNMIQYGYRATGRDLTKDLSSQIAKFRSFHQALNELSNKGAPYSLIQQLEQLGPEALPEIRALLRMNPNQLGNYFDMFRKAQQMINKQALADLHKQLDEYRKYGQNIALAIVAGLQDENVAMTKAIKNMLKSMFPGLVSKHHQAATTIKPPPKPPTHHAVQMHPTTGVRGNSRMSYSPTSSSRTPVHVHHHYTYQVTAPEGSDIGTQVRHADYHSRQRRRHNSNNDQ